jgi:hypothetical protein
MRGRVLPLALVAASLVSCGRATTAATASRPPALPFRVEPLDLTSRPWLDPTTSPSPFVQITAGNVQAIVPETWEARALPDTETPQHGFIASPRISDWERRAASVNGLEAFWVDEADVGIPSDYYYLVARGPALAALGAKGCHPSHSEVFVDHPPDLTGAKFSPSDYVASGTGVCHTRSGRIRWAYVVAAPGFGPLRGVGIPTSGLYVVIAAASGRRSGALVDAMIHGAEFGDASVSQIEKAAIESR